MYRGIKFPLVASSLSLPPSLLLALVSRGKHELERNERHSSEKLRFQGATGNLCCFYPRLANRFSRFRVSLVRKANFIDAIQGSGGMGDRNWCARIDRIGDTESRGCVFEFRRDETFYASFLPPRAKPGETLRFSPRFIRSRFYERPSVLIFGRHTTRVAFSSNYVDTVLNFPLFHFSLHDSTIRVHE